MFKKLVGTVSKTLDSLGQDAAPMMEPAGPTEASVYKNLLVELQYNQLLISREYQQLFKEKEEEIRRLKKAAGEPLEEADGLESPKKEAAPAKPLKELTPDELRVVLKEWDRKMKNNIVQKTEALAEAKIYRESVDLLRAQMDVMKSRLQEQELKLKEVDMVSKRQGSLDHSRAAQEAAMEKLGVEFAALGAELTEAREKLMQALLENEALKRKAESDSKTLELLSKSVPAGDSEVQSLLQQREEEWNRTMNEIREDAKATQAQLQVELQTALEQCTHFEAQLAEARANLDNMMSMQADMVNRSKQAADEELATVSSERDEAITKLKDSERVFKEAQDKLSRAENELQRLIRERDELVSSRDASSQRDIESKESALEATRQELYAAQRSLDDFRANAESQAEAAKSSLEAKQKEVEELLAVNEDLKQEKEAMATMGARSLQQAQDAQSELAKLTAAHELQLDQLKKESETERHSLQAEVDVLAQETNAQKRRMEELTLQAEEHSNRAQTLDAEIAASKVQLANAIEQRTALEQQLGELTTANSRMSAEIVQMKKQLEETAERIEREVERVRSECLEEQNRRLKEQSEQHAMELSKAKKETAEFKELYTKETQIRRQVHDELMDLKGNIRVFARVRPVLPDEKRMAEDRSGAAGSEIVTDFPSESQGRDIIIKRDGAREGSDARFEFDRVFDPTSAQEEVFETVSPLITSVMDGVNVTLFAYGQTGSGKTFTMEGSKENPGVNVRALQKVFELAQERAATYTYTFSVSVLEVYLESILDLLGDVEAKDARERLDIRMNPDTKQVFVQGLVKRTVTNMNEVQEILQLASKNRTVGAHNMNEHSSRSHLVFTLTAVGQSLVKKEKFEGNLNLIDLAGSERVGKTDATGERLKEAQSINKSLSALGDVINALSLKNDHIPFRNSKLTYLLQDNLKGNAKVGFFANVSPTAFNSSETMCTLNFANRCRKTELGKAKRNVTGGDAEQLKQENARLRRQLEELQGGASTGRTSEAPTPTSTPVRTPSKTLASSAGSKRGLEKD